MGLTLFIQMQLCEDTLHDWLSQRNKSATSADYVTVMSLFRQIAAGVQYIHSRGIIHRDLKVSVNAHNEKFTL